MSEELTVKKFMLKKFPTNEYMDCPVPRHHWETIQEYAEQFAKQHALEFAQWICDNGYDSIQIGVNPQWKSFGYNQPEYTTSELYKLYIIESKTK